MNLHPNKPVYGVAPEILLDCAKQLHRFARPFSFDQFCKALGAPKSEARPVFDQMIQDGYMRPQDDEHGMFGPQKKLAQLALANITDGIPRQQAEQLLKSVIRKALEINGNPDKHQCSIDCLIVFGSYLGRKSVLGDVDIGVEIQPVGSPARKPDQSLRDFVLGTGSPVEKARSALRLGRPKQISIHQLDEVVRLETPFKVVFGDLPASYAHPAAKHWGGLLSCA